MRRRIHTHARHHMRRRINTHARQAQIENYASVHDEHIYTHAEFIYILKSRMSNLVSQVMERWFSAHRDNPYPSEEEKRVLIMKKKNLNPKP